MNQRLRRFEDALVRVPDHASHWRDVADDPNDPLAIAFRARALRAAWRDPVPARDAFIVARARGRRVLDVGCVAHDIARMAAPQWLHRQVAAAADSCVGVDILADGIAHMQTLGFTAVVHDLTSGPGPLAELEPFDVIVAGELIEHVADLDMLFTAAKALLTEGGELVLTTPNPYAPNRVRAGQRGECWENTDHIMYAFPSGIAELADRHGLALTEARTTMPSPRSAAGLRAKARSLRAKVRGSAWMTVGVTTVGSPAAVPIRAPRQSIAHLGDGHRRFLGETFIYVVSRRESRPDA